MSSHLLNIIGGGLAGAEAAFRVVTHGLSAVIWEMKPQKFSPAHKSPDLAELVCSNSFRAFSPANAVGLLKEELEFLGSVVMEAAKTTEVPAGKALAVDRTLFSKRVTELLTSHPNITIRREEFTKWPDDCNPEAPNPEARNPIVVATGPLTSEPLVEMLQKLTGENNLSFYDALAPIVTYESLDLSRVFSGDRYGEEGEGDYLNAPMDREEFLKFYEALINADLLTPRSFEDAKYFEGCLPIEVMAKRGIKTLTFGPMKPVGLIDPKTSKKPFAVVQLRRENKEGTTWNLVGFQTRLKIGSQREVFRLIPGLSNAEFVRYGAIHRNTYLEAPKVLDPYQRLLSSPHIFIGGQLSGVEGYVESTAQGLWAGENAARAALRLPLVLPPPETAIGALISHLHPNSHRKNFSPSNINFGLFPAAPDTVPRKEHGSYRISNAREKLQLFLKEINYKKVIFS
jgi:methylenetetrahydrofolate--tRNA-(uracil-5-)-methyltransferase